MKVGFEVVGSKVAERKLTSFGDVVADFELGFCQAGEAAPVE